MISNSPLLIRGNLRHWLTKEGLKKVVNFQRELRITAFCVWDLDHPALKITVGSSLLTMSRLNFLPNQSAKRTSFSRNIKRQY